MSDATTIPRTGDDCPSGNCPGHLTVYSSHENSGFQVRYYRCWKCEATPAQNPVTIEATAITKRRRRQNS